MVLVEKDKTLRRITVVFGSSGDPYANEVVPDTFGCNR